MKYTKYKQPITEDSVLGIVVLLTTITIVGMLGTAIAIGM